MPIRVALTDFALKNPYYAGASCSVYEVNENLQQTGTLATIYAAPTGPTLRTNPMVLDSDGTFPNAPLYVEKPVILVVTPVAATAEALGVQGLVARWRGVWASGTLYYPGERFRHPSSPATYVVLVGHTSNNFATDLSNGLFELEIDADSMAQAAAADLFGTVLPDSPAEGYYRINAGGTGVEALTAAQVLADLGAFPSIGGNISGDVNMTGVGALKVPSGLTGQRPTVPVNGMIRYNSDLARVEMYDAGDWRSIGRNSEDIWARIVDIVVTGSPGVIQWALPSNFRLYRILLTNIAVATGGAGVDLYCRIGRGGGPVLGGASDYEISSSWRDGVTAGAVNGASNVMVLTANGLLTEPIFVDMTITPGATAIRPVLHALSRWTSNTPAHAHGTMTANVPSGSGEASAVTFGFLAGGIFANQGFITILGLKA